MDLLIRGQEALSATDGKRKTNKGRTLDHVHIFTAYGRILADRRVIKVRIRVRSETGDFAVVVCAENLQWAAQSVSERYPSSAVEVAFPIEPEQFFARDPRHGEYVDLEVGERMGSNRGRST